MRGRDSNGTAGKNVLSIYASLQARLLLLCVLQNKGQVVDSAMVDGVAYLSSFLLNTQKIGIWTGHCTTYISE